MPRNVSADVALILTADEALALERLLQLAAHLPAIEKLVDDDEDNRWRLNEDERRREDEDNARDRRRALERVLPLCVAATDLRDVLDALQRPRRAA